MTRIAARAAAGLVLLAGLRAWASPPPEPPPPPPTRLPPADAVRFVAFGDAGSGLPIQYAVGNAMAEVCAARGCDFAIELGDNFYPSGVNNILDPQFQEKFEKPYAPLNFPIFVVLGNHDTGVNGSSRDNRLGDVQVQYSRSGLSKKFRMPARYYNFIVPAKRGKAPLAEFFALDSNPATMVRPPADDRLEPLPYTLQELDWFSGALSKSQARWKIAFAHHPYVSNGVAGNAGSYPRDQRKTWRFADGRWWKGFLNRSACKQGTLDLYLQGHDHDLEWLAPTPACGKTQFITSGAAGSGPSQFYPRHNPSFWRKTDTHGFFWIRLDRDQMTVAAYTLAGGGLLPHDGKDQAIPEFEQTAPRRNTQPGAALDGGPLDADQGAPGEEEGESAAEEEAEGKGN